MKRIVFFVTILLVSAVLLLPFATTSTAEAADQVLLGMSGGTTEDGVYVDVSLLRNAGISALKLRLEYDKKALVYDRVRNMDNALSSLPFTASGSEVSVDDVRFMYGPSAPDNSTGLLVRIYFKITDNAAEGSYKVNLVVEDALGEGKQNLSVSVNPARIHIGANGVSVEEQQPVDGKTVGIVVGCVAVVVLFVVLVAVKASRR